MPDGDVLQKLSPNCLSKGINKTYTVDKEETSKLLYNDKLRLKRGLILFATELLLLSLSLFSSTYLFDLNIGGS